MPVQLSRSRETGAILWNKTCEVCAAPASFGYNCSPVRGVGMILAGQRDEGYRRLGQWYCAEHRPDRPAPAAAQESLF
jgi:hypothetical protein